MAADRAAGGKPAAFFDLDRTLMAGASTFHFARAAYRRRMISRREIAGDAIAQIRFRLKGVSDEAADLARRRVLEAIKGLRQRDLERLTPEIMVGILPRIYPQMLDLVHSLQDAGIRCYVATAASQEAAQLLAATLAMDGAIGSRAEIVDGVYTGEMAGPFAYGQGKAQAVEEFAEREGLDLSASYAYSDSVSDLPLLRLVGHPVAVNPDSGLSAVAKEEGWEVLRFDRLARRLAIVGTTAVAVAVGGTGTALFARRKKSTAPRRAQISRRSGKLMRSALKIPRVHR